MFREERSIRWIPALLCSLAGQFLVAQSFVMDNGLVATCSGTFYDGGDAGGNYSANADRTYTICPTNSAQKLSITFTMFDVEAGVDQLSVYHGTDMSVLLGHYSNANSPNGLTLVSTAPSGCLTFRFTSNGTVQLAGWSATIACQAAVPGGEICGNGLDDDFNGFVDDYDAQCAGNAPCTVVNDEYNGVFTPSVRCSYASMVSAYASPMVGDVDNDGEVEIIIVTRDAGEGVLILNGDDCTMEAFIDLPGTIDLKHGNVALGDVDANGYIDIFATTDTNGDLYRIEFDGTSYVIRWTAIGVVTSDRKHLEILDLDRNGVPEIVPNMGNMVNALTGAVYPGTIPGVHMHNKGISAFTADADLGNNGNEADVELVRGSQIFRYDLVANTWNLIRALPAPYNTIGWTETANVALADMDLDGDVDAVVSSFDLGQLMIWDLQTATVMASGSLFNAGTYAGRATIGNFDTDPYPEFAFVSANIIYGMQDIVNANSGAGGYEVLWSAATTDMSGHTGMTLFDFEGDGYRELVYRDTDRLRVFRGRGNGAGGPLVLFDSGPNTCYSDTGSEFPVVADVTNDNEANIVVACNGSVSVYQSGNRPWVPARPLWNTQTYVYTNVNDDGTIPAQFQENYLVFNDFMAQRGNYIGGDPTLMPGADLELSLVTTSGDNGFIRKVCTDSIGLVLSYCNIGSAATATEIVRAIYKNDPYSAAPAPSLDRADTLVLISSLAPGECFVDTLWLPDDDGQFHSLVVNHVHAAGPLPIPPDTTYNTFAECDHTNNAIRLFDMTVADTEPPVITRPADLTVGSSPGICGAIVTYATPGVSDNCSGATVARVSGPASGHIFPPGNTTVTWMATDASGNTSTCSFIVTVTTIDTDGDGICDNVDLDDDNDGIPDIQEGCGNLVANGDFEMDDFTDPLAYPNGFTGPNGTFIGTTYNSNTLAGWSYTLNVDGWRQGGTWASAFSGSQYMDLIGNTNVTGGVPNVLYQDLQTMPGAQYDLGFHWGEDVGHNAGQIVTLNVRILDAGSNIVFDTTMTRIAQGPMGGVNGPNTWIPFQRTFTAPTTPCRLAFMATPPVGNSGAGAALDAVSVVTLDAFCTDSDGDGVPDSRDLDSDNDGIYDVVEAGSGQPFTNGVLNGTVTAFGIPTSVDADANNIVDYLIKDSDGDGTMDSQELDADDDGCNDVIEAGYTDSDNDGLLGAAPVTVDGSGLVTSGGP